VDEWSARRRDIYLTTHNTHKRPTSIPPTGFEPAIPAGKWPQTDTLDRAATRIGSYVIKLTWVVVWLRTCVRIKYEAFYMVWIILLICWWRNVIKMTHVKQHFFRCLTVWRHSVRKRCSLHLSAFTVCKIRFCCNDCTLKIVWVAKDGKLMLRM
jgi:hypothetical protein